MFFCVNVLPFSCVTVASLFCVIVFSLLRLSMAYRYMGVTHDAGISKKSQKPYDICQVLIAVDAKASRRQDRKAAHGFESESFELDPNAIGQFAKVQPFSMVELCFEPNPRNPRLNWVTGIKSATPSVAA